MSAPEGLVDAFTAYGFHAVEQHPVSADTVPSTGLTATDEDNYAVQFRVVEPCPPGSTVRELKSAVIVTTEELFMEALLRFPRIYNEAIALDRYRNALDRAETQVPANVKAAKRIGGRPPHEIDAHLQLRPVEGAAVPGSILPRVCARCVETVSRTVA